MIQYNHQTAPTQLVEAKGIRFAYRRFGESDGMPLVFNQHFRGTMDYWDPAVTDGLAKNREVILFNNAGVSSTSGQVPTTIQEMGANAVAFIKALGLSKVDVLGFSIGGMVAQEIAAQAPDLARRLFLVGTGPRGADMSTSKSAEIFAGSYDPPEHLWLAVHFSPSPSSGAAGLAFLQRKLLRKDRDPEVSEEAAAAQREAINKYYAPAESGLYYLKDIHQPTLVVQGSNDVIVPTANSHILPRHPRDGARPRPSRRRLAGLYRDQGRYDEAEQIYKRALTVWQKALGPDHRYVGASLNNLAELYLAQRRYGEAESLYQHALAIWEKVRGPDHPNVGAALNNLARTGSGEAPVALSGAVWAVWLGRVVAAFRYCNPCLSGNFRHR